MPSVNPEVLKAKAKRYRTKHAAKIAAKKRMTKEKRKEYRLTYIMRHPERERARQRRRHFRKKYKLYGAQFEQLLNQHTAEVIGGAIHGTCGICRGVTQLSVDHAHSCCPAGKSCGKCIRGLLCRNCNHGIGAFKDSVKRLFAAVEYLNREVPCLT